MVVKALLSSSCWKLILSIRIISVRRRLSSPCANWLYEFTILNGGFYNNGDYADVILGKNPRKRWQDVLEQVVLKQDVFKRDNLRL